MIVSCGVWRRLIRPTMLNVKKLAKILLIYFSLVFLGSFYFTNFTWIGHPCETRGEPQYICVSTPLGGKSQRYLTLQSCMDGQRKQYTPFICASGPDPERRCATIYSSYRTVYYSEEEELIRHNPSFSFFWLPLHLIFSLGPAFLLIILWIIIHVARKVASVGRISLRHTPND